MMEEFVIPIHREELLTETTDRFSIQNEIKVENLEETEIATMIDGKFKFCFVYIALLVSFMFGGKKKRGDFNQLSKFCIHVLSHSHSKQIMRKNITLSFFFNYTFPEIGDRLKEKNNEGSESQEDFTTTLSKMQQEGVWSICSHENFDPLFCIIK
jgi:hypothetical protein